MKETDSAALRAQSLCDRCGRPLGRGRCERYCASDTVNGMTGEVDCLEVGLELARARAEEAEKARDEMAQHQVSCAEAIYGSWAAKAQDLLRNMRTLIAKDTTFPGAVLRVEIDRLLGPAAPPLPSAEQQETLSGAPAACPAAEDLLAVMKWIESPPWAIATSDPETLCRWMQKTAAHAIMVWGPYLARIAHRNAADRPPPAPPAARPLAEHLRNHLLYVHPRPWRVGNKVARNVYDLNGEGVTMFTHAYTAAIVVDAVNRLGTDAVPASGIASGVEAAPVPAFTSRERARSAAPALSPSASAEKQEGPTK